MLLLLGSVATVAWALDSFPSEDGEVLYIWKSKREMMLVRDGQILRKFEIQIGSNSYEAKQVRGDRATPVGRYFVREKKANSTWRRFLGLNYPNLTDADRGLDRGLIDDGQWTDIFFANMQRKIPPAATALGGQVGIHGYGGRPPLPVDWTKGCIAVTDPEIDYLYDMVELGTPVVIYE